jgi:hypothetical protein
LLGLAIGIKYPAIIYIVALAPLVVWAAWCCSERFLRAARNLALFSIFCIAAALPWLIKNWLLLGSPLYPFLGDTRIQPWLAAFYPDANDALPIIHETLRWGTQVSAPFSILTLIREPAALAVETEGALYFPNPIFVLLPLWVFLIRRSRILNWLIVPAVGYLIILTHYWPYSVVRYLIPAMVPFTIVSVDIAVRAWRRFLPSRSVVGLSVLIFGITLVPFGVIVKAELIRTDVLAHAIGRSSAENHFAKRRKVYAEIVSYVNQNLPKEARVLLIYDARGYYFNVPAIQDNTFANWPLLARSEAATNCLRSTGISHVLVNVESLRYYLRRGVDPQALQWEAFREFSRRCLTPIRGTRAYTLFRVKE